MHSGPKCHLVLEIAYKTLSCSCTIATTVNNKIIDKKNIMIGKKNNSKTNNNGDWSIFLLDSNDLVKYLPIDFYNDKNPHGYL